MKLVFFFLSWIVLIPCCQAQTARPSGYLYKVDTAIPGKTVFVCGEHPFSGNRAVVGGGDLAQQTRQVFENLKTSLATVNMTLDDVAQMKFSVKNASPEVNVEVAALLTNIGLFYFKKMPKLTAVKNTAKVVQDDILIAIEVVSIK
ncbi:RidA family protein [Spirosoma koreense]